jgi:small-conductance mechanosensitive channel
MSELFQNITPWQQSAFVVLAAFSAHLIISRVLLRGMKKVAASTDNDVDDRLVHFLQRFYILVLVFVVFLVILRIHEIEITPFLASAGIAGIAIGMAARKRLPMSLRASFSSRIARLTSLRGIRRCALWGVR